MRSKICFFENKYLNICYLFFGLLSTVCFSQLVHPGISHKLSDLERMKHMVEAGIEPYASTFKNLSSHAKAQHTYAVNVVNQDPSYITEYSSDSDAWFINDGTAAYYNALMWYITGDSRHAEKAIEIFNTWKGLKRNSMSVPLSSGRVWRIIEAAEIIKHTYSGWAESDIQEFKDMLVYPGYSTTTVPTAAIASSDITFYWRIYQGDPARHGNQGLFCMRTMMAMGIFLDNEIMYNRALRYLQGEPARVDDLSYPSGPSIVSDQKTACEYFDEYTRTGTGTAIADYGYNEVIEHYIYENGQCQESSRDQAHGLAGVATITVMSEMAWNQGDDLYGHLDNRPLLGLEFYYRYNLSYDNVYPDQQNPWEPSVASGEYIERTDRSGRWKSLKVNPYLVCDTGEDFRERAKHNLMPVYEMNLAHYRDRIGVSSDDYKWLQRGFEYLTNEIGIEGEGTVTDHPGYGGLKFHRESPGDPINGFDVDGVPEYKIPSLPAIIEAENYDYFVLNGNGRSYSDSDASNTGGTYRNDEDVDINVCSEGGYAVTDIKNGEWLTYTVNVPVSGSYDISIRYASVNGNGKIKFSFSDQEVSSEVTVPFAGEHSNGKNDWKDLKLASGVNLKKGVQQLKVLFSGENNSFELNNINVALVEAEQVAVNLAPIHGTATHSVDSDPCPYGGCAELAIDGNTNGNFGSGSVSHSSHGTDGSLKWWQVDLGDNYKIETIDIYNRTGYENRLSDITIDIVDTEGTVTFSQFYEGYPNPVLSIPFDEGVLGSIVKISKTSATGITLAEVEVYGIDSPVTLSNDELSIEKNVKIFPNPVASEFTITNCKGAKLVIFNMLGEQVFSNTIEKNNQLISVGHLKNGIYFVKVNRIGNTFTRKILIN